MSPSDRSSRIETIRHFSRFYTRKLGVLHEHLLDSPFSLAEGRIVYELAHQETTTAATLAKALSLDASYLARLLKGLQKRGVIKRQPSPADGRENSVSLTDQGQQDFALLNARSRNQVAALLDPLSEDEQQRLVEAIAEIERILDEPPRHRVPYILRPHQPGDIGWVIQRHGMLYAHEYGWDTSFEGLVAQIAAQFIQTFDPKREHCWIAEKDGENVGSVFLVCETDTVAKLRLLLVEPSARGLGIGQRLVAECIRFARQKGYRELTLWTNDILIAARTIYQKAGFQLVKEESHHSFGHDLVGQYWALTL